MYTALAAVIIAGASQGEPIAPNRTEPDYKLKDLGHLQFYHTVRVRGVLYWFGHIRKLEPPPEVHYSAYVLTTPGVYSASYRVNTRETYFYTGLGEFYVEAPHHLTHPLSGPHC